MIVIADQAGAGPKLSLSECLDFLSDLMRFGPPSSAPRSVAMLRDFVHQFRDCNGEPLPAAVHAITHEAVEMLDPATSADELADWLDDRARELRGRQ